MEMQSRVSLNVADIMNTLTSDLSERELPLISKPFRSFEPLEFLEYCQAMKEIPERFKGRKPKPIPIAAGLKVGRTKRGAISITRTKAKRPFAYVLRTEIEELASVNDIKISELWNAFRAKEFIIAESKMQAETIYGELNNMPF